MSLNHYLQKVIEKYKSEKVFYEPLVKYLEGNLATRKYAEVCEDNRWDYIIDHLAVRTHNIDEAAKRFIPLGWTYFDKVEFRDQGWWAKVYRHSSFPALFIDQSYDDAPDNLLIIKRWVDKFGDKGFHHAAVRLPQGVEIEDAISLMNKKGINFPGKITGATGTRLRQIFSQAEVVDGAPFSVIELIQRNVDSKTGKVYMGFIAEQADSLMKDSVL